MANRASGPGEDDLDRAQVSMTTRVAPLLADDGERPDADHLSALADASYFGALRDNPACALLVSSLDGTVQMWNAGAERLLGHTAEEAQGKSLETLVPEVAARLARVTDGAAAEHDLRLRRRDGTAVDVSVAASAVRNLSGQVLGKLLWLRDITDRVTLERRLQSLGQMEALARVASGFAHDLNNILTIAGTYQTFVAETELSSVQMADLKVARDAVERGAALVERLLSLSQNRPSDFVVTDLNEVASRNEETFRRFLGHGIQLAAKLAPQPLPVRAAQGQIDQILLNLVLNARDAMPSGGTLSIGVRSVSVGDEHALAGELAPGTYAALSVADTGSGIDQATLPHIFEPFFTTKPLGEGTGLGLLIVRDIVTQLRGAVRIKTAVGVGTELEVYLPLYQAPPLVESLRPPDAEQPTKTILVVDEDEAIRAALKRVLHSQGYSVLLAADGFDAGELAARHDGAIDLLLCDLHQSREDGRQTLARVRITRPNIRAVFLSGRPVKAGYVEPDVRVVRKPFTAEIVLSALAQQLSTSAAVAAGPLPARPVVLVVDDDLELREAVLRLLGESELELHGAKSGLHALQVLENRHVDLVVSDQMMAGMDGVQLLEVVRERWPHCQRVLLTGHPSSDVVLGAVNRGGVTKVLTKNMHPVAIRDEIEQAALTVPRFAGPLSAGSTR